MIPTLLEPTMDRTTTSAVTDAGSPPSKKELSHHFASSGASPSRLRSMDRSHTRPVPTAKEPSNTAIPAKVQSTAKPILKPKRPLSAFNLFYRYKRQQILAIPRVNANKDGITRLVQTSPGLEDYTAYAVQDESSYPPPIRDLRRNIIREVLKDNLLPRDTQDRCHRKNKGAINGAMSFLELGKLMNTSWKNCDDFAKSVFNELSDEGRVYYQKRMKECNSARQVILMKEKAEANGSVSSAKQQDSSRSKKSNKNEAVKKATMKPERIESNDDSAKTETYEVRKDHLREHHSILNPTSDSINHSPVPNVQDLLRVPVPSLQDLQPNRDVSYAGGARTQAQVTRTTVPHTTLRAVSKNCRAPQEIPNRNAQGNNNLMMCVRELEGQLVAEQLRRLRVRELEGQLAAELLRRQRIRELDEQIANERLRRYAREIELERLLGRRHRVEDQLRALPGEFLHAGLGRSAPSTRLKVDHPPDGLASLVNANMINRGVRALERVDMMSRMMNDRRHPLSLHQPLPHDSVAPRQHLFMPESEYVNNHRSMDHPMNDDASNKKQRYN